MIRVRILLIIDEGNVHLGGNEQVNCKALLPAVGRFVALMLYRMRVEHANTCQMARRGHGTATAVTSLPPSLPPSLCKREFAVSNVKLVASVSLLSFSYLTLCTYDQHTLTFRSSDGP